MDWQRAHSTFCNKDRRVQAKKIKAIVTGGHISSVTDLQETKFLCLLGLTNVRC